MKQITGIAKALTLVQRLSVAAAVLAAAGVIGAVVYFHHEGDFRALYTGMAPEDAAPVVQKLKEAGVDYRLEAGGGSVLVPSARIADSRLALAAAGLPKSGRIGFELFDKTNFGATELVEHVNYQRALEGELERSVMSMSDVTGARVHLTLPRDSVFLDQQQPAKASVLLRLRAGAQLSQQNVLAVCNLVASAVEGLNADQVAVLDMDGHLLSRPKRASSAESEVTSEALEVRQSIERDLVSKITSTLEPLLGPDQFRAGASVECDLTSGEEQEETYNPDQSVMTSSQKSEDSNERGPATGGIPGTQANLPKTAGTGTSSGSTHRTENVTYQSSRVIKHTKIPQGVVRRMSLSVLIGQPVRYEGTGKARHRVIEPPSPETMKTIRDLIAGVTGFNEDRGDQLIVESLPFESVTASETLSVNGTTSGEKPKAPQPAWLEAIDKYRSLIGFAIAGLFVLAIIIKIVVSTLYSKNNRSESEDEGLMERLKAAAELRLMSTRNDQSDKKSEKSEQAMLAEAQGEIADRVRQFAQKDSAAAANVLRMWIQEQKS